jgi:hypothetical protein
MANSFFLSDKELEDLASKIVKDLYENKDITELKFNGKQLTGNLGSMLERQISGIYSNITGHKSLQTVLVNGMRYSVIIEKNASLEAEFKKLREACERRKNMRLVIQRKLELDKDNEQLKSELDKTNLEISLLETKINEIAQKNSEPPNFRKNILELSKKAYKLLLRSDKTSEKLYTFICNKLNVKLDNDHFGYYQRKDNDFNNYNSHNSHNNHYNNNRYNRYNNTNQEEKKDVYVPPQLQRRY